MGKDYSQRPSNFLGLHPASWEAYQFDMLVRAVGVAWENEQFEEAKEERPRGSGFSSSSNKMQKPNASWGDTKGIPGVTFVK